MTDGVDRFTPAQQQVMAKVADMLEEHFKGGVVAVIADDTSDGKEGDELLALKYFGGFSCAVGVVERAKKAIMEDDDNEN